MAERYGINFNKENSNVNLISVYYTEKLSVQYYSPSHKKHIEQGYFGMIRVTDGEGILTTIHGAHSIKKGDVLFVHFSELVTHITTSKNYKYYSVYFNAENLNLLIDKPLCVPLDSEEIENYEKMILCLNEANQLSLLKANALFSMNLSYILKISEVKGSALPYFEQIKACVAYIHENLSESIKTRDLASMCCLCEKHFTTLFTNQIGLTPKQFIIKVKLERASYLLMYSDKTVEQIAFDLNFFSAAYFISTFKRHFGKTPSQFRKDTFINNRDTEPS